MRTTTLTRAARMRITTTVKRMRHVVAFSGMNASFCDKKYRRHHRPTRRRSIGAVADQNHEGEQRAQKRRRPLPLVRPFLTGNLRGGRSHARFDGRILKSWIFGRALRVRFKNGRARKRGGEQTVGGKRRLFYANAIPNREDAFKTVLEECGKRNPIDVVVFDRFLAEEAYSFRVREMCADALRVLDMQDCHALRRERARIVGLRE